MHEEKFTDFYVKCPSLLSDFSQKLEERVDKF